MVSRIVSQPFPNFPPDILSPLVLPSIVPFTLGDKPAHMDQFLSINCAVSDGDLPLNIFWTFNNQPITPDMDVSINRLGKRTSVLTIDSVSGHHAGNYSCHGSNPAGSTSYLSELKVIGVLRTAAHIFQSKRRCVTFNK